MSNLQSNLTFFAEHGSEARSSTAGDAKAGDNGLNKTSDPAVQALELLRQESRTHAEQVSQTGLLGRAFSGATEFWHHSGDTGKKVDDLASRISSDIGSGKKAEAVRLAEDAGQTIAADRKAMDSRSGVVGVGDGVVEAAGLFMAGKKGFVVAAGVAALEAFKPGSKDSAATQATDIGLGVARSVALKGAFAGASKLNLGMATTAVGLGVTSRLTDLTLNRSTYIDQTTGQYSAGAGAARIWAGASDRGALATDIGSMLLAKGALGKLNEATDGALLRNRAVGNIAIGGVFGMTSGAAAEVVRQEKTGTFDAAALAERTIVSGATSAAGAALAGGMAFADAKPNFAGSTSREYQIVGNLPDTGGHSLSQYMVGDRGASLLARVREVKNDGQLGPEQNLLVQHGGKQVALDAKLATNADIIASCEPDTLPGGYRLKHIMPSLQRTLWMSEKGTNRLSFSDTPNGGLGLYDRLSNFLKPERQAVALGDQSVSSILRDPSTYKLLRHKGVHDLGFYADILKDFKTPARRVIDGGADSVVVDLADNNILKVTHLDWDPQWGKRTFEGQNGVRFRFDAKIIGEPHTVDRPDGVATWYLQERAETPVSREAMNSFRDTLTNSGQYYFTDADPSQLGYVPTRNGNKGLVLLDYDAVQTPQAVMWEARGYGNPRRYGFND